MWMELIHYTLLANTINANTVRTALTYHEKHAMPARANNRHTAPVIDEELLELHLPRQVADRLQGKRRERKKRGKKRKQPNE